MIISKQEVIKLLSGDELYRFLQEFKKEENYELRQLWDLKDEIDIEEEVVGKFVELFSRIGVDIVRRYRESKAIVNKYVVDMEGMDVNRVLEKYGSRHSGEMIWIGEVREDGKVEIYVKNGELLV